MQDSFHLPRQLPLRVRVLEYLKKWEWLVPIKQTEGRYTVSQPLALVLIGVLGTAFFAYYWRSSDKMDQQHDEIIRLQTLLASEEKKNIHQDSLIDQAMNRAINAERSQATLQGKFDQFALTYSIKNANRASVNGGIPQ